MITVVRAKNGRFGKTLEPELPVSVLRSRIMDPSLAPMLERLARKVAMSHVTESELNVVVKVFTYDTRWECAIDVSLRNAITQFERACRIAFGRALPDFTNRVRVGTVRGEDLQHLFSLEL